MFGLTIGLHMRVDSELREGLALVVLDGAGLMKSRAPISKLRLRAALPVAWQRSRWRGSRADGFLRRIDGTRTMLFMTHNKPAAAARRQ
jgi:hypothetical protein